MGLYRYSDENECLQKVEDKKVEEKKVESCDPQSAKALKRILSLLDDLNNKDLRILEEIIERLLCSREKF
jgi:hypothetical protein